MQHILAAYENSFIYGYGVMYSLCYWYMYLLSHKHSIVEVNGANNGCGCYSTYDVSVHMYSTAMHYIYMYMFMKNV